MMATRRQMSRREMKHRPSNVFLAWTYNSTENNLACENVYKGAPTRHLIQRKEKRTQKVFFLFKLNDIYLFTFI